MDRSLASSISAARQVEVTGTFQRHTSPQYRSLRGSRSGGRWGLPGASPVIYLGRPTESIIAEAYRHLVDPTEGLTGDHVGPRVLLTCDVSIASILDLTSADALRTVGLVAGDLTAYDYSRCQRVGAAAHQLGLSGILAPAATELGQTHAVFERNVPPDSLRVTAEEVWVRLPADPRPRDFPVDALLMRYRSSKRDQRSEDNRDELRSDEVN